MIVESIEQISGVIEKMMEQGNHASAEELAWTILSLENGMVIFHYVAEGHAPLTCMVKRYKIFLSLTKS